MDKSELAARLETLNSQKVSACIGLDGFVDRIVRVVDKRLSPDEVTYVRTLGDYGGRIAAAGGLSLNFELVPLLQKLGGNGPIMANALSRLGADVSCIGAFGLPEPAKEFAPLARNARLYSVAQHASTDAYEFDDGKIIASALAPLNALSWEQIEKNVGLGILVALFANASLIALNNWTMIPHMTEIWQHLQIAVFPRLTMRQRIIFLDLADPSKRTDEDIHAAMDTIRGFGGFGTVLLSCNKREAMILGRVLGLALDEGEPAEAARRLQETLGIDIVSIHTLDAAFASERGQVFSAPGFFVSSPVISVGGGDHFNAGLAYGLLHAFPLEGALLLAGAVSGYYVRSGVSPDREQLLSFLQS